MVLSTLLYIEDIDLNIQLVKRMLKFMPYQILSATTAKSGLAMAQMHKPDLILMDVNLPDMDGLNLTAIMKTYDTLRNIPVVAFTADSSQETYKRCHEVGCEAYINKPISRATLLRVLNECLADRKAVI